MRITRVKVTPTGFPRLSSITIDDSIRVNGLAVSGNGIGEYRISMPGGDSKSGAYVELAYALNTPTRKIIHDAVIAEYERVIRIGVRDS